MPLQRKHSRTSNLQTRPHATPTRKQRLKGPAGNPRHPKKFKEFLNVHPGGPLLVVSADEIYDWHGSVSWIRQDFTFNRVVSEIIENPTPHPHILSSFLQLLISNQTHTT